MAALPGNCKSARRRHDHGRLRTPAIRTRLPRRDHYAAASCAARAQMKVSNCARPGQAGCDAANRWGPVHVPPRARGLASRQRKSPMHCCAGPEADPHGIRGDRFDFRVNPRPLCGWSRNTPTRALSARGAAGRGGALRPGHRNDLGRLRSEQRGTSGEPSWSGIRKPESESSVTRNIHAKICT